MPPANSVSVRFTWDPFEAHYTIVRFSPILSGLPCGYSVMALVLHTSHIAPSGYMPYEPRG